VIKKGRVVAEKAKTIKLTSVQQLDVVNLLERQSEVKRTQRSLLSILSKCAGLPKSSPEIHDMQKIYRWMVQCMAGFGIAIEDTNWPFWAWHHSVGMTLNHQYLKRPHVIEEGVLLELSVPSEHVILSDYSLFEVVMQGVYIASSLDDHHRYFAESEEVAKDIRRLAKARGCFPETLNAIQIHDYDYALGAPNGWNISDGHPLKQRTIASWPRIFDANSKMLLVPSSLSGVKEITLQATLPFLRSEWIVSATRIKTGKQIGRHGIRK